MSSAIARTRLTYDVPPTQNTALVLQFRCLYTHDLKRKQKRWQDGMLKFHTFNKRIMVYDTSGGYIGDKHWKDGTITEGDELRLDAAVLVEVQEPVGRTETDLSELFQQKSNGVDKSTSAIKSSSTDNDGPDRLTERSPPSLSSILASRPPLGGRSAAPLSTMPPRHKSLKALLGTKNGRSGKAVLPTKSPYEQRQEEQEVEGAARAAKRSHREAHETTDRPDRISPRKRMALAPPRKITVLSPAGSPHVVEMNGESLQTSSPDVVEILPNAHDQNAVPSAMTGRRAATDARAANIGKGIQRTRVRSSSPSIIDDLAAIKRKPKDRPARRESLTPLQSESKATQARPVRPKTLRIVKAPPRSMLLCTAQGLSQKGGRGPAVEASAGKAPQASALGTSKKTTSDGKPARRKSILEALDADSSETDSDTTLRRLSASKTTKIGRNQRRKSILTALDAQLSESESGVAGLTLTLKRGSTGTLKAREERLSLRATDDLSDVSVQHEAANVDDNAVGQLIIPGLEARAQSPESSAQKAITTSADVFSNRPRAPKRSSATSTRSPKEPVTGASAKKLKQSPRAEERSRKRSSAVSDDAQKNPTLKKARISKKTKKAVLETAAEESLTVDKDVGPWSTEAYDLFDWRPPD